MRYDPYRHHRRSIRLKRYDYSQKGLYFITLCCKDKTHLFGQIIDGEMVLNAFGKIVFAEWEATPEIRKNISLGAFIIMPNHIHGILKIDYTTSHKQTGAGKFKSPSQTIGAIARGYKGATTRKMKDCLKKLEAEKESRRGELHSPTKHREKGECNSPQQMRLKISEGSIWQRDYYDIIIRNERALKNISAYIINNPSKWKEDKFYSREG